jgi:hypothetical protein
MSVSYEGLESVLTSLDGFQKLLLQSWRCVEQVYRRAMRSFNVR